MPRTAPVMMREILERRTFGQDIPAGAIRYTLGRIVVYSDTKPLLIEAESTFVFAHAQLHCIANSAYPIYCIVPAELDCAVLSLRPSWYEQGDGSFLNGWRADMMLSAFDGMVSGTLFVKNRAYTLDLRGDEPVLTAITTKDRERLLDACFRWWVESHFPTIDPLAVNFEGSFMASLSAHTHATNFILFNGTLEAATQLPGGAPIYASMNERPVGQTLVYDTRAVAPPAWVYPDMPQLMIGKHLAMYRFPPGTVFKFLDELFQV